MTIYPFEKLSVNSKCLLAVYALFNPKQNAVKKVIFSFKKKDSDLLKLLKNLSGDVNFDIDVETRKLAQEGLLTVDAFNWRNDSYDYRIGDDMLVPYMAYLYEKEKRLAQNLLEQATFLTPTMLQKLLWTYVGSGYTTINGELLAECVKHDIGTYLLPVVFNEAFAMLLLQLPTYEFYNLAEAAMTDVLSQEELVDPNYMRSMIESYKIGIDQDMKKRLLCLVDLYEFVAYGRMPSGPLLATNKNHRIIAAIAELYKGKATDAFKHFAAALKLHNAQTSRYGRRESFLPVAITNFFYVLAAYLDGSETARKAAMAVYKTGINDEAAVSAAVLYGILANELSDVRMKNFLSGLMQKNERVNKMLGILMQRYTGLYKGTDDSPRWMLLKQEMRTYVSFDSETKQLLDSAYGPKPLLASIYRKQEWENVLEELMGRGSGSKGTGGSMQTDTRVCYILSGIKEKYLEVRVQKILKSGQWGAGKLVSMANFANLNVPEMSEVDKRIAMSMSRNRYYTSALRVEAVLPEMTGESRLYVGRHAPFDLVNVVEVPPYLNLNRTPDGFDVSSNVNLEDMAEDIAIVDREGITITFARLDKTQQTFYGKLLSLGHFPLDAEEQLRTFLSKVGGKIDVNSDLIEGGSTMPVVEGSSLLTLQIKPAERGTYEVRTFVKPLADGAVQCWPGNGDEMIVDRDANQRYLRVKRDIKAEKKNLKELATAVGLAPRAFRKVAVFDAGDMLPVLEYAQEHQDTMNCEWQEGARIKISNRGTASWGASIKKNENGWFEIEGTVDLDADKVVSMSELLDLVGKSHGRYIKISDTEFVAISDKLHKQLTQLNAIASRSHGRLQLSPFSAALLGSDVLKGELTLEQDKELVAIRKRIKDASSYTPEVPQTLNATLREYQKEGYCWMARLNKWGAGALLADDMGLGKTVQTITFLLLKAEEGPALVVAPASVAPNWKTEFEKFAPSLNVSMLNFANDRDALVSNAKAGDVIITTYGLLLSVQDALTKKHWTTICLDEAHIIKNRGAKTSAVAMQLKSDNRVMLTGTPVQNHLSELWNLFQFVNPGLLGSYEDFNRRFITPIEVNGDKLMQHELDRLVKPFMLRRTKDKVAKELPNKEEIYQHVTLSEDEMIIYEVLRRKAEAMLLSEGSNKVSMNTLAEITRLRQCSCDCQLVEEGREGGNVKRGSKITALVELLETMIEGFTVDKKGKMNGGVLVFSQFTSYLALIKKALDEEKIPYLYIDGSVDIKTRQKLVEEFQNGSCPVFLISLKAGGLGLNLTRANYVIHTDPWWNPAIEAQATDRAHRIGQQQAVTVYHLIAEGTIEEKIQRLHEKKQALAKDILESTDMSHKLTGEDLLEMVRQR